MPVEPGTHIGLQELPFHASAHDNVAPAEHALDCMADAEFLGFPMEKELPFHGSEASAGGME